MRLTKALVKWIHAQTCFDCIWSTIDPFDWGLRCCNRRSGHVTDYCPEYGCAHYDRREAETADNLEAVDDLNH